MAHYLFLTVYHPGHSFAHFAADNLMRLSDDTHQRITTCLARLTAGDSSAHADLIGLARERMMGIAHRMLRAFPTVQRWDQTDDVVQNASMRLERALAATTPTDVCHFIRLAAVHIRRELLDLARKYSGPESWANNHATNGGRVDERESLKVDMASDDALLNDQMARWALLHQAAATLPEEEREVFHLAWYLGLKQREIAGQLGCAVRTVKRRWESAKQLLADAMDGTPPE